MRALVPFFQLHLSIFCLFFFLLLFAVFFYVIWELEKFFTGQKSRTRDTDVEINYC